MKVVSSHLSELDYEGDTLKVTFKNGKTYKYDKVPQALFRALMESRSKGTFFHRFIAKYKKGEMVKT